MNTPQRQKIIVAVTGASGVELGRATLAELRRHDIETHLILSEGAKAVIRAETAFRAEDFYALADYTYSDDEIGARIASGSFYTDGMIVVPCSMKTLSGIANAYDENLTVRAADVCLKEQRKVVLVPREMPLNKAHLRNMLQAAEDGCVILPPVLSFYNGADTVEKQVEHIVGKILMQFHLIPDTFHPWEGPHA